MPHLLRPARLLPLAVVLLTASAHLRFLWLDTRPPRDLCNCQQSLPRLASSVAVSPADALPDAARILLTPTGWYDLLRVAAVSTFGASPELLQLFDLVAVTAVVAATALLAARLFGDPGIAALLVAAMPALVVEGRQGWIHVPEAALVMAAYFVWSLDLRLERRRTLVIVGLLGAAAIALRPSGLVWVALLLPLARDAPRRALPVLGAWGLAALIPLSGIAEYLLAKAAARDRYATVIPELAPQLLVMIGPAALVVLTLGLTMAMTRTIRGKRPPWALSVTVGWVATALVLAFVFRAGLDNHTLLLPALAILAAWGLQAVPRLGLGLAGLVFLVQMGPQWAPLPSATSPYWRVPDPLRAHVAPSILNYYVPFSAYGVPQVRALLDAVCDPGRCMVIVDQGLYLPYGEEPGVYELFAAGEDRPTLHPVRALTVDDAPKIDALVAFDCPQSDGAWNVRWPEAQATRDALIRRFRLGPAWGAEVAPGCMVRWYTPERWVAHPERLPAGR